MGPGRGPIRGGTENRSQHTGLMGGGGDKGVGAPKKREPTWETLGCKRRQNSRPCLCHLGLFSPPSNDICRWEGVLAAMGEG